VQPFDLVFRPIIARFYLFPIECKSSNLALTDAEMHSDGPTGSWLPDLFDTASVESLSIAW